jgi:hypothetical protein
MLKPAFLVKQVNEIWGVGQQAALDVENNFLHHSNHQVHYVHRLGRHQQVQNPDLNCGECLVSRYRPDRFPDDLIHKSCFMIQLIAIFTMLHHHGIRIAVKVTDAL